MLYAAKMIVEILVDAAKGQPADAFTLWGWVAAEFALAAISQAIGRGVDFLDSIIAERFSQSLGLKIMHHAATLDLCSFEDPAFRDTLDRARAQVTDRTAMLTSMGWLLQRIVMLVSLSGGILYFSPWLLAVLSISVIPAFLVESHFAFLGYTLAHELTPARRWMDYLLNLGSSREAAKEVKVFGLAPYLESKYAYISSDIVVKNRWLSARRFRWGSVFAVFASAGYYGSYAYLANEALNQRIGMGDFTFLLGAVAGANGHLQTIFSLFSSIADQALFLRDLMLFFHEKPKVTSPARAIRVSRPIREGLEFENVSFKYPGTDRLILDNLSLRIEKGQRVALVGENGEGKTTFVKLIARLYDPTEGRILLDGRDLRDYDVDDLRRQIGVIFQDFTRYDLPARENIAAGNIDLVDDDSALWEALKRSNAEQFIGKLPEGLDQMLGRRFDGGIDLSGGQWQRLALARAYLRNSQVLILDEPTAALDPAAEYEVFQKFAELAQDRTAVFISHRFSTVRMADRIIVLSQGQVAEDGSHKELLEVGGLYANLFEIQASSYR